ncbi:MAG: sensor histidine kinase [candidate division Zixibacteria bacterium]|nr:sensor histidine kinase [candidate division Zixibacteria bacterium]
MFSDHSIDIDRTARRKRFWLATAVTVGGATFITFFVSILSHLRYIQKGLETHLGTWLLGESFDWFTWAALVPVIIWFAKKVRITRQKAGWTIPAHFLFGAFTSVVTLVIGVIGSVWAHNEQMTTAQLIDLCMREIIWMLPWSLFIYSGIVAVYYALDYYRRYNERELRTSKLETELTRAQLDTLHTQLQPHFLFNTLNSISVLMRKGEIDTAQRMLNRLSELLRHVLAKGGTQEIALETEMEIVKGYLEIEQTRFGERLHVIVNVDDSCLKARVPSFVLQTLVENAVRHGLANKVGHGQVTVAAAKENGFLKLTVQDDGVGLDVPSRSTGEGVGLRTTRTRLAALYGERYRFALTSPDNGGTLATLEIPLQIGEK